MMFSSHSFRPRKRSVRAFGVIAVTATLVLVSGCATSGGDSGTTTLTFFSWDSKEVMEPLIAEFEDQNPDITVDFSNAPPVAEYISALQTRLLSKTAADVFIMASENRTSLMQGGFVKDLTDKPYMSVINDANKEKYSTDDKVYAMSLSAWGGGVLYNEDLLAKVGMSTPPATWDDYLTLLASLKSSGVTPYYEAAQGTNLMTLWALLGAKFDGEGGGIDAKIFDGKATFTDEWTSSLELWNEMFEEGLVPRDAVGLNDDAVLDEFVNGRVAMIGTGPWNVASVKAQAPDLKINFMAVPTPTAGETYLAGSSSPGYAINASTSHEKAADLFLTYLSSDEGVKLYQGETNAITTTSNYSPVLDPALDTVNEGVQAGHNYLPMASWPRDQDALRTEMLAKIQEMVNGSISPAEVTKAMDAKLAELSK
jgi:raffinose/stachyose/melibiose transport system substrate-binding protein